MLCSLEHPRNNQDIDINWRFGYSIFKSVFFLKAWKESLCGSYRKKRATGMDFQINQDPKSLAGPMPLEVINKRRTDCLFTFGHTLPLGKNYTPLKAQDDRLPSLDNLVWNLTLIDTSGKTRYYNGHSH